MPALQDDKAALRRRQRALQRVTPTEQLHDAGVAIQAHLATWLAPRRAQRIACFASLPTEVDTEPLIEQMQSAGIDVALPVVDGDDLRWRLLTGSVTALLAGAFGVRIPGDDAAEVALSSCDVVVVPGLAFDHGGDRLGYGKGYYDRALHLLDDDVPKVGIGTDAQLVPAVPAEPHDVKLTHVCTPTAGVVRCTVG